MVGAVIAFGQQQCAILLTLLIGFPNICPIASSLFGNRQTLGKWIRIRFKVHIVDGYELTSGIYWICLPPDMVAEDY